MCRLMRDTGNTKDIDFPEQGSTDLTPLGI